MVPSSRGLGRGPLKAATRVRIPLGSPFLLYVQKKNPELQSDDEWRLMCLRFQC